MTQRTARRMLESGEETRHRREGWAGHWRPHCSSGASIGMHVRKPSRTAHCLQSAALGWDHLWATISLSPMAHLRLHAV